jgi:hypothetical protein
MAKQLQKKIGSKVNVYWHKLNGPQVCMSGDSARAFISFIGKCPVKCFSYKWNIREKRVRDVDLMQWSHARLTDTDAAFALRRAQKKNPTPEDSAPSPEASADARSTARESEAKGSEAEGAP